MIGHNNARLNNEKIVTKDQSVLLKPGDKIELLEGLYEHELIFVNATSEDKESNKNE